MCIRDRSSNLKQDLASPCEATNLKFIPSPELTHACQQFGRLVQQNTSPEKCYADGRGLTVVEVGEEAAAVLNVVDHNGMPYTKPVGEALTCELVSDVTGEKMVCSVKQLTIRSQYEIGFQPTSPGRYHLHVKVEEEHIKESPFAVTVIRKL